MQNLLLSGGPAHDFRATSASLDSLFGQAGFLTTIVETPDAALGQLRAAEAGDRAPIDLFTVNALHWSMGGERYAHLRDAHGYTLGPDDADIIERFVTSGGGLLALHSAVICFDAQPAWRDLCGASWNWNASHHQPPGPVTVRVTDAGRSHKITAPVEGFVVVDEIYEDLDAGPGIVSLLSHHGECGISPLLWARRVGDGRVVTDLLGHGLESLEHPTHCTILLRAAAWAARRPDRLVNPSAGSKGP